MPEEPGERVLDIPEPPLPEEPGERILDVPEASPAPAGNSVCDANWWRALSESCKGRLPPMYRAFLDMCQGAWENGQLTIYAPDEITLGRLDNDRVKGVLSEETERATGTAPRILFHVGEPPQSAPKENLKNLLQFGSRFDNIEIK